MSGFSDHMRWMLKHAEHAPAWSRPIVMEATVRGGEKVDEVFAAFDATPAERERTIALLGEGRD